MFRVLGRYLNVGDPEWTVRRRLAVAITLFAMWMIVYGAVWLGHDRDTAVLAASLISDGRTILMAVLTVYVAAATIDGHLKRLNAGDDAPPPSQGD